MSVGKTTNATRVGWSLVRGHLPYNPFIRPTLPSVVPPDIKKAFGEVAAKLSTHKAFNHPLFKYMEEAAKSRGLTPEQCDRFRSAMFRRIYPTLGYIAGTATHAANTGNRKHFITALKNLKEEGAEAKGEQHIHPALCEEAFNAFSVQVFGLRPLWMVDAVGIKTRSLSPQPTYKLKLPEEVTYHAVSSYVYRHYPALASWISESASGGDNCSRKGMMGDLFGVFSAYQGNFAPGHFDRHVLPYFKEHISLRENADGVYNIAFNGKGIEFNHALRAQEDLMGSFTSIKAFREVVPYMYAFANAQGCLFDAILQDIENARDIGTPVPCVPYKKVVATASNPVGGLEEKATKPSVRPGKPKVSFSEMCADSRDKTNRSPS